MSILDDDVTTGLSKIGGPIVLFVLTPNLIWITWKVYSPDFWTMNQVELINLAVMLVILLVQTIFGVWMCRKGYGWFGGKGPKKPEL